MKKELSIEEKAKRYDKAIKKLQEALSPTADGCEISGLTRRCVEEIFPELKESEDEKIRKELIEHIKANKCADYVLFKKFSPDDVIAWLEKQESVGEIVERCKTSWYNEGKIAGMAEGLTEDEKYQQGWHDALEKQGEQNPAWSEEDEDMFNDVIIDLKIFRDKDPGEAGKAAYQREIDWLKSLKERIV